MLCHRSSSVPCFLLPTECQQQPPHTHPYNPDVTNENVSRRGQISPGVEGQWGRPKLPRETTAFQQAHFSCPDCTSQGGHENVRSHMSPNPISRIPNHRSQGQLVTLRGKISSIPTTHRKITATPEKRQKYMCSYLLLKLKTTP